MIRVAQQDASTHVRGWPFWLGQKAGKKAVAAITGAITDDPETEVKKKAVFALSQLPKEDGVPMLIQVRRRTATPRSASRRCSGSASRATRALAFFQEVLAR
jgi:hypothetical protein